MILAQHAKGSIIGIHLFQKFVDIINSNALALELHHRGNAIVSSMDNLPIHDEERDLYGLRVPFISLALNAG